MPTTAAQETTVLVNLRRSLWHSIVVLLSFAAFFTLFFAPVLLTQRLLAPGDGIAYYLPAFYAAKTLWTDLIFGGYPIAADSQNMTWYPPALILSLIPHSWNAFVLSAYVLSASFAYCYTYTVTASKLAAAVTGLVYSMSGFMLSHLGHAGMIHPAAWIPLLVCALERLRHRLTPSWVAIGSGAIACSCLAGHPQIFVYGLGTGFFYALLLGWTAPIGRRLFYRYACGMFFGGLGLAAIQIIPTWELSRLSVRSEMTLTSFLTFSLPIQQILQLLFPYFFGSGFLSPHQVYPLSYWGEWDLSEISGYVGLLPIILAAIAVLAYPQRAITRFWLGFGLITLLATFGGDLPIAPMLYHVPVYNKFRAQGRHFIEVALAVAVLAGLGVSSIQRRRTTQQLMLQVMSGSVLVMLICLISMVVWRPAFQTRISQLGIAHQNWVAWDNAAIVIPCGVLVASILVLLIWQRRLKARWSAFLLLTMVAIDLSSFGWFFNWQGAAPEEEHLQLNPVVQAYRDVLQHHHQRFLTATGTAIESLDQAYGLFPNLTRLWQLPMAGGYTPLTMTRVSEMMQMTSSGALWQIPAPPDRRLDLMSVRYLLLPAGAGAPPSIPLSSELLIPPAAARASQPGIAWNQQDLALSLGAGACLSTAQTAWQLDFPELSRETTEIGLVTSMGCAIAVPHRTEVLKLQVTNGQGQVTTHSLQAGRDTAEAAHDCPDIQPQMQHQRAQVFRSMAMTRPGGITCAAHHYVSYVKLPQPQRIKRLTLQAGQISAVIATHRISLIDRPHHRSTPITPIAKLSSWQKVGQVSNANIYENHQVLPRTWLVPETIVLPPAQILATIRTARLPDGRGYQPQTMALVEDAAARLSASVLSPTDTAQVLNIANTHAEIQTQTKAAAFLVLSDVNYLGWQATIDGQPTPIFQTNYVQRGVKVPAGHHVVRFEFHPRSFQLGVGITMATLFGGGYCLCQIKRSAIA